MPQPTGGNIADGIYDLVAQREFVYDGFAPIYTRAALRFSGGVTQAEHIYDSASQFADSETPHRHMTVEQQGASLELVVTCPDIVLMPRYQRGFSVEGDELWLFQKSLIEVYRRRS